MRVLGIDVSEHNGSIDWQNMKNNGIKFAIIRSSYGHFVEDKQFRRNVKECERVGMPYGLYHYSYVATIAQMKEEAVGFLKLAKSCKPTYPIYIDMEDADGWKKRNGVSDAMNIETCYYTCNYLEQNGYYAGIYANLDWLLNRINSAKLDKFDKWVAQWAPQNTYPKPYGMWQFTSSGKVNGYSGRLDMNYAYKDYPQIIKDARLNGTKPIPTPPKPSVTKYKVGDVVAYTGLWTQSNGGNWYPRSHLAVKTGKITKVIVGAQHPYLIGANIGWANDKVIDDAKKVKPALHDVVSFSGLWTQSNGGTWYPKDKLAVKSGKITKIIAGAQHPYLIDNGIGWANDKVIEEG